LEGFLAFHIRFCLSSPTVAAQHCGPDTESESVRCGSVLAPKKRKIQNAGAQKRNKP
jgi:hypothetical protein